MKPFLLPLMLGAFAGAAAFKWALYPSFADSTAAMSFGGTIASIGITMLGFMLAALAVLASINHTHLVKMMRAYGHYSDLLATMMISGLLFLLVALTGYGILFGARICAVLLSVVVGIHVAALASMLDVVRKLWFVLSNLRSDP